MLSRTAHRLDLPRLLLEAVGLKRRRRGASDAETLWSLIASLESARTGDFYFGTDNLDLHRPPCRNFRANQAFYACGQIARLLLRAVQYELLPIAARTHGLRTLIRHLIRAAARLVRSGRRWRLDFAKTNFRLDWLLYAAWQLE